MGLGKSDPARRTQRPYSVKCVKSIYYAIKRTQFLLSERFPQMTPFLPHDIHFIHAEELRRLYPQLGPKEREDKIAAQYGAVFVRGIGGPLGDNTVHDGRAPDYDDWTRKQNPVYQRPTRYNLHHRYSGCF